MEIKLDNSWTEFLKEEFQKKYMSSLKEFLKREKRQ